MGENVRKDYFDIMHCVCVYVCVHEVGRFLILQ